jgi:hypothetical protein
MSIKPDQILLTIARYNANVSKETAEKSIKLHMGNEFSQDLFDVTWIRLETVYGKDTPIPRNIVIYGFSGRR